MSIEIEYRVVPVTRYIVTRFYREDDGPRQAGGVSEKGEFQNEMVAYEVGRALAEGERQALSYSLDDPRIKFPAPPGIAESGAR